MSKTKEKRRLDSSITQVLAAGEVPTTKAWLPQSDTMVAIILFFVPSSFWKASYEWQGQKSATYRSEAKTREEVARLKKNGIAGPEITSVD